MFFILALILNSGYGSRMGCITEKSHKSMVHISDSETLIYYQINTLAKSGIKKFLITTGYMKNELEDHIRTNFKDSFLDITFVENPLFKTTNYIYSIYLALEYLNNEDIVLIHGDLYFDTNIIPHFLESKESILLVDTTLPLPEKDFKAEIESNRVKKVATYINENCVACQPFYKLNKSDWLIWANAIEEFCMNKNTNVYAEEALNTILEKFHLKPYDIKGELCMEIDTPEELELLKSKLMLRGEKTYE